VTQPAEPTPGAPATEPTPHDAPAAPVPPSAPASTAPPTVNPTDPVDVSALPANVQHLISDLRRQAAKIRTGDQQAAAEQARQDIAKQVAKALGIGGDDEPVDPAELTAEIEQAQAQAWRSGVELQVYRMAGQHGADPARLLDSLAFIDSLDDLVDVDPASPDFRQALATKVQEAVASNPLYKVSGPEPAPPTAPRPDPSQGPKGPAAPTRPTSLFDAIQRHIAPK
jgi:hypothetical protein